NSTLRKLQTIAAEVVGAEGVYHSVASASAKEKAASELLEERGLGINTPYASSIAEALLDHHIRELEASPIPARAIYICETLIPADRKLIELNPRCLSQGIRRLIRLASADTKGSLRDIIKRLVLTDSTLGDPRRYPGQWD